MKDELEGTVSLYTIVDIVSNTHVSNPIPALNDGVAMNGFISFLKGEEEKGLAKQMYKLVRIGDFALDGRIINAGEVVNICDGKNAEIAFKEWCEVALAQERMED